MAKLNTSGAITAVTTFGPGGPLARNTGGRTLLYTPDAQGNVSQQVNASTGAVVASYAYDAWGGRTVATSDPTAASDPYAGYGGLNGYYTDWETGLQLCGLRYYDSAAGRWLNRDPISYAGGVNVYEYCGNGPVGMSDASGLMEDGFGPNWGAVGNCLATFGNIVNGVGGSSCAGTIASLLDVLCQVISSCGISAIASFISTAEKWAPEAGGFTAVVPGWTCIVGGIAGLIQSFSGVVCDELTDPCFKFTPADLCNLVGSVIIGCLGGTFGSAVGLGGGALQSLICSHFFSNKVTV